MARRPITDIVSLTVIGPDVLEADRFATAAFAMGRDGILFHRADARSRRLRRRQQRPRHPDQRFRSPSRAMLKTIDRFSITSPCTGWSSTI